MTATIREISVENQVEQLGEIYACLETFVADAGLAETVKNRLLLVAEELFTNLVRYGYADGARDIVTLRVASENAAVRLTIRDHAASFDVSQPPKQPSANDDLASMAVGGLGLCLVHQFSSKQESWREGAANVTELVIADDI